MAELGLEITPDHRELLRMATNLNGNYATMLAKGDGEAAAPVFEKAANHARRLLAAHRELTFPERFSAANALRNEARSHAQRKDASKTIASLSEAFEAGLLAASRLPADKDFAFLRGNPDYVALLRRWEKHEEPPEKLDYPLGPHPLDAVEFQGRWYKYYGGALPWHLAQLECQEKGGYLACITSEAESMFVRSAWPQGNYWLGGAHYPDGAWRWITGEPVTYTSWAEGEPFEDGGRINAGPDGLWRGAIADEEMDFGYVCEWEE
jgi:hypothetical protein